MLAVVKVKFGTVLYTLTYLSNEHFRLYLSNKIKKKKKSPIKLYIFRNLYEKLLFGFYSLQGEGKTKRKTQTTPPSMIQGVPLVL